MNSSILTFNEDELQSPTIPGWLCVLHNAVIALMFWLAFAIQKAVFNAFQRLGSRHINSIIVPTLVLMDGFFPIFLVLYFLRSFYYPLSDLIGVEMCHIFNFFQTWAGMTAQFHSFFLTFFRFICLFYDHKLMKLNISPKALARGVLIIHHVIPLLITIFLINASIPGRTLNTCLGHFELNVGNRGNVFCTEGSWLSRILCHFSFMTYFTLASNIPEAILLYPCFKKIKKQNEEAKSLLGENSYVRRRKDIGIVINISILQWALEIVQLFIYLTYIIFLNGYSSTADKFFTLYIASFVLIFQPAFWLNGDAEFRTTLVSEGFLAAFKSVLFPKER